MMAQWKKILENNKETNYEVSDLGEVRNIKTKKILKGTLCRNEYRTVQLTIEGKPKSKMVHRLVAEAFIPNPDSYNIVDHIDRNKHNNSAKNLRWVNSRINNQNRSSKKQRQNSVSFFEGDINQLKPLLINSDYLATEDGRIVNAKTKRILKGSLRNDYKRFYIKAKWYSGHRLIWEAFKGPIPKGSYIDHIDGNRSNNALNNLRLVSQSENMYNVTTLGNGTAKKIYQYDLQGNFIAEYKSIRAAAKELSISDVAIGSAIKRQGSSGGYLWLEEKSDVLMKELIAKNNKPRSDAIGVTQYDIQGNKVQHYNSIKMAAQAISCSPSTISRGANAKRLAKGYYWILDNSDTVIEDLL